MLYIFNYFSVWLVIWFLLYKFKVIKIQPSFNYILAFIYLLLKGFIYFLTKPVDLNIFINNILISVILDFIPLLSILPLNLTKLTLSYNLYYLCSYVLILGLMKIDIIKIYIDNITYNSLKNKI